MASKAVLTIGVIQNFEMSKTIQLVSYDRNWPHIFEKEAALIKQAFGRDNYIAIHRISLTSVPSLFAKPKFIYKGE